jgi:hypothetical protein
VEDFAKFIKVSRKSIYNWRKEHDDFDEALDKINNEQYLRLVGGGLAGTYNPVISKLMLSSNHGLVERVDKTSKGEPINAFNDDQINRIAERIASRGGVDGGIASETKPH